MVKQLAEDLRYFIFNKIYGFVVFLAAVCAYGFQVTHVAVGIDDTTMPMYYAEGLEAVMGRWTLFMLNKIIHFSDFAPWMTDLIGVLFLILAASIWCVLLHRVFYDEVPFLGYTFFAALFITCPLISELYVFYLHNGLGVGYVLSALSLLLVQNALEKDKDIRMCCRNLLAAAFLLVASLGCYESFAIVYAIGALLLFITQRTGGNSSRANVYIKSTWRWGLFSGIPLVVAVLLRGFVVKLICKVFSLALPENFVFGNYRSTFSLFSWNRSELAMYFKRFWVKFYLNGLVYLPITVLVLGIGILLIFSVCYGVKKKDVSLPLAAVAIPILPALMILVEGKESYYRSCQYVPLVGAFGVLLLFRAGHRYLRNKAVRCLGVVLAAALLWNQCTDMNRWFYLDYLKYEYFKDVMITVFRDLERDYDLSKPIVFGGECPVPYFIVEDASVDVASQQFRIIKALGDMVDPHLIEKYIESSGRFYIFAETPVFSTIQWGITAFDDTSREIRNFLSMIGYEIRIETDLQKIKDARPLMDSMPHFPYDGYIQEYEDYLIVHF